MPGGNRPRAADAGADVRPDAVGGLVGRAHVLFSRRGRCLEGAGARRRGARAGGHAAASRADRPRARSARGGQAALRRGGDSGCNGSRSTATRLRRCHRRCAMSAILVAVNGPQAGEWLDALARACQGPRAARLAGRDRRSGRHRLCLRLDCAARPAGGISKSQGDHQSRRRRRSSARRSAPAAGAGGARGACRSHRAGHRICRAACADAPSAAAALRRAAARAALARARSAGGERGCGRRDGARRDRQPCGGRARRGWASRSRAGAARRRACPASRPFTATPASTHSWRGRKSWSACCRGRRDTEGHLESRAVPQAQARRRGRRRVPHQRRAGPVAGRCRYRGRARRRHARRRHARRVSAGAAAAAKARCGRIPRSRSRRTTPAIFRRACSRPHVIAQIERFERGLPLDNAVDRTRGY